MACQSGRAAPDAPQKVERLTANYLNFMSYLEQFEAELFAKIEHGTEDTAAIVRWVSEKVLESYRNGITAGQNGAKVSRQGKSRRPFPPRAQ